MGIISQINSYNNPSEVHDIGALDRNIYITDSNQNIINTLYNKLANIDSRTGDLSNLIYENSDKNNIFIKNSTDTLTVKATIDQDGTLIINKINPISEILFNGLGEENNQIVLKDKAVFKWENADRFGLRAYYKNDGGTWEDTRTASGNGEPFIWWWQRNTSSSSSDYEFYINAPTHIRHGGLYIERDDNPAPRIEVTTIKRGASSNLSGNIGFRFYLAKSNSEDSQGKRPLCFQYAQHTPGANDDGSIVSTDWTTFLYKNVNGDGNGNLDKYLYMPEGFVQIGNEEITNGDAALKLKTHHKAIGLINRVSNSNNTQSTSYGLYEWTGNNSGKWILRVSSNGNLICENAPFRVYNNDFRIGTLQGNSSTSYITMGVISSNDVSKGEINVSGNITTESIECETIYPPMYSNSYRLEDSIIIRSGEAKTYTLIDDSEDETIKTAYALRSIPCTNPTLNKRLFTLYTDNNGLLKITSYWGAANTDQTKITVKNFSASESDIRLKQNIHDTEIKALDTINQIQIRQFDWKKSQTHQKIGFIADELEQIDPNLSIGGGYDEEGSFDTKSVNTFYLQGYEVKAIQELYQQIQNLKEQIKQLKQK